jgi:hypothetical protein
MGDSGFADLEVHHIEVSDLLDMMKARIRRISHIEKSEASDFAEVSRLARMCFLLASVPAGRDGVIHRMSKEDIEAVYVLPHGVKTSGVLGSLNEVRGRARSAAGIDPEVADQAAKSVYEVMET